MCGGAVYPHCILILQTVHLIKGSLWDIQRGLDGKFPHMRLCRELSLWRAEEGSHWTPLAGNLHDTWQASMTQASPVKSLSPHRSWATYGLHAMRLSSLLDQPTKAQQQPS